MDGVSDQEATLSSFFFLHNGAMVLVTCLRHTSVCGVPNMAELSATQRH